MRAERVNLLEEALQPLAPVGERLVLELRPFEVVTLRLHFTSEPGPSGAER